MKNLKLVINNNKNENYFFNKYELKLILNLYAKMVSGGEWKDYGLTISSKEVNFNIYRRATEFPIYKITKYFKPKNKYQRYTIQDSTNRVINNSENLYNLINNITWKKLRLVN